MVKLPARPISPAGVAEQLPIRPISQLAPQRRSSAAPDHVPPAVHRSRVDRSQEHRCFGLPVALADDRATPLSPHAVGGEMARLRYQIFQRAVIAVPHTGWSSRYRSPWAADRRAVARCFSIASRISSDSDSSEDIGRAARDGAEREHAAAWGHRSGNQVHWLSVKAGSARRRRSASPRSLAPLCCPWTTSGARWGTRWR